MSPSRKNGRAWFKLGEPHASHTKPFSEEQRVAGFFLRFIESSRPLRLVELDGKPRLAAADAFAAGNAAGIGGWWLPKECPARVV